MNKLRKELCDCYYVPPKLPAQKQEIEECHQALINILGKPEGRLVLQIIDSQGRIVEDTLSTVLSLDLSWHGDSSQTESIRKREFSLSPYGEEIGRSFYVWNGRYGISEYAPRLQP